MKICSKCGIGKDEKEFYFKCKKTGKLRPECKNCWRENLKVRREKILAQWRRATKKYYKKHPKTIKLKKYGITEQEYEKMFEEQEGKCCICKEEKSLNVDHCHFSEKVRGLLCRDCNLGLGNFKDNTEFLRRAIEYLS